MDVKKEIKEMCDSVAELLIEKNRKYGNSALDPLRVFSKADPLESIRVRMDDKLCRIRNEQADEDEDPYMDLMGYLVLYMVARKGRTDDTRTLLYGKPIDEASDDNLRRALAHMLHSPLDTTDDINCIRAQYDRRHLRFLDEAGMLLALKDTSKASVDAAVEKINRMYAGVDGYKTLPRNMTTNALWDMLGKTDYNRQLCKAIAIKNELKNRGAWDNCDDLIKKHVKEYVDGLDKLTDKAEDVQREADMDAAVRSMTMEQLEKEVVVAAHQNDWAWLARISKEMRRRSDLEKPVDGDDSSVLPTT